jgi:hypothetical protein
VSEEVPEPSLTDFADTAPVQGKPRCITLIFYNYRICICCAFTLQEFYDTHIYIPTYIIIITCCLYLLVLLVQGRVVALLRFASSVGNLSLLTTGDYYYHKTKNEMVERKW